jgi:hypothetical protein
MFVLLDRAPQSMVYYTALEQDKIFDIGIPRAFYHQGVNHLFPLLLDIHTQSSPHCNLPVICNQSLQVTLPSSPSNAFFAGKPTSRAFESTCALWSLWLGFTNTVKFRSLRGMRIRTLYFQRFLDHHH